MGRTRFLLYRYFIFLTARPWAERGSCSTATLFFYFFLSVTRPKLPLAAAVKTLMYWTVYEHFTIYLLQNALPFCVIEALDSKLVLNV